jgi:hypothetical protein
MQRRREQRTVIYGQIETAQASRALRTGEDGRFWRWANNSINFQKEVSESRCGRFKKIGDMDVRKTGFVIVKTRSRSWGALRVLINALTVEIGESVGRSWQVTTTHTIVHQCPGAPSYEMPVVVVRR